MADRSDETRWFNIVFAVFLLGSMGAYALFKASEIQALPYRFDENNIASNGSSILDTESPPIL